MSLRMEYRSVSFTELSSLKEHRYVVKPDFWIYDWLKIAFNECEQTDYSTDSAPLRGKTSHRTWQILLWVEGECANDEVMRVIEVNPLTKWRNVN